MLIDFHQMVTAHDLKIGGVLHLGAHLAEEAPQYQNLNEGAGTTVWWVEANPHVLPKLSQIIRGYSNQHLIQALIFEEDGLTKDFNVTNYDGMSSSLLEFGTHTSFSPDTVFVDKVVGITSTVDTLVDRYSIKANTLVMDLQGGELFALKGATEFLKSVDYVMSEVNNEEVYIGCAKIDELDAILHDFQRVETYWVPGQGWGDGWWIRR